MFAPLLAGVMRAVVAGMVFAGFKMLLSYLNRELVQPVQRERIRRASARILAEEEMPWSESEVHDIVRYKSHDV